MTINEKSKGARLLGEWLEKHGKSQRELGRIIGVQAGVVSRWVSGERRPSVQKAVLVQRKCRIPVASWTV